jgi:capsular exopolysaccharide synthesis family protein
LSTQFGPNYPAVQETSNQLKQIQASIQTEIKRMGGRLEGDYRAALQREQLLQGALDKQKIEANKLNERAIQYSLLKRDLDTNQQLYDNLLQRMKEASVAAAMKAGNIRIVDPARPPTAPVSPKVLNNISLGFFGGLAFGVVLALLVEVLDNTVRTPEQVLNISSLPSLGIVPMSSRYKLGGGDDPETRVELISHQHPRSEIAESYRALRTSILLSSLGAPPQVILITSALPQEGKTTTALNSGIVLAQQGGKVLIIDADLRRPSVHEPLGIRAAGGLSTVLAGRHSAEDVIVPSPQVPNLYVMPAGPPPPHPAELLGSDLMKELVEKLRSEYHHIVIDTPPALSVTDSVALSVIADSVVLVIRSGGTSKEALRRTRELLMRVNAKVTGVVVNALDLRSPDLSHYYYGGMNYGKYYQYTDDSTTEKKR